MEKLIVLTEEKARLLVDVQKFDGRWMESIDGQWVFIEDTHFEVTHLSELEVANLLWTLTNGLDVDEDDTTWTENINWEDPELKREIEIVDEFFKNYTSDVTFNEKTGEVVIDGTKHVSYEKEIWFPISDSEKENITYPIDKCMDWNGLIEGKYDISEGDSKSVKYTVNLSGLNKENAEKELQQLIADYQSNISFDNNTGSLNWNISYDYKENDDLYEFKVSPFKSYEITDQMIDLIAESITAPTIVTEYDDLEEAAYLLFQSLNIDTKSLVRKLLNNGSIAYENIFDVKESKIVGLSEIQHDLLRYEDNIWKHGYGVFQRNLHSGQVSKIDLYPNDEFKSYADMMNSLYDELNLDNEPFKLICSIGQFYYDNTRSSTFKQKIFIKKSFIDQRYFNVEPTDEFNTVESFENFINLIETSIAEFYEHILKCDIRFIKKDISIKA